MSSGNVGFLSALVESLQSDSELVTLTGHSPGDKRILRGQPPKAEKLPFLGVNIRVATALNKYVTFIKRYVVSLSGYGKHEIDAIRIADRVEELFHNLSGESNSYYDFTNIDLRIYSSRFSSRISHPYDNDNDRFMDENIIEIVANVYGSGCE